MNHIYKIIWSKVKGCYVVVSEIALSHDKGSSRTRNGAAAALLAAAILTSGAMGIMPAEAAAVKGAPAAETETVKAKAKTALTAEEEAAELLAAQATAAIEPASDENNNLSWGKDAGVAKGTDNDPIQNSVAIGTKAVVYSSNSVALGNGATVNPYTYGNGEVGEANSVAIGSQAGVTGQAAIAIGSSASAAQDHAVAIGGFSSATEGSAAIGGHTIANNTSIAIGSYDDTDTNKEIPVTSATGTHSVAIGYQTSANSTENALAIGTNAYVHSNDGIAIGAHAQNNAGSVDGGVALGSYSAVDTNRNVGNKDFAGYDPRIGGITTTLTDPVWKATKGAVSVGAWGEGNAEITRQITHVAAGTKDSDAVNVAQLKNLRDAMDAAGKLGHDYSLIANPDADSNGVYTVKDGAVTLKVKDSVGGEIKDVTISGIGTGTGSGSWDLTTNSDAANKATIGKNDTVDFTGANGVKVSNNGAKVTVGLDNKITLGEKGEHGQDGQPGKDGHIGLNGKDGQSADITVIKGEPGVDGKDGITRIQYVDENGGKHETATLDDGLKFKGDINNAAGVKLNKQVNIVGGQTDQSKLSDAANIGVVTGQTDADGNLKLDVKLAKDLTDLSSVTIGGPIDGKEGTSSVVINNDGINAGGKVITNAGTTDGKDINDVVNVDYLNKQLEGKVSTDYRLVNGTETLKPADDKGNAAVTGYKVDKDGNVALTVKNGTGENAAKTTVNIGNIATKQSVDDLSDLAVKYDSKEKNSVTLSKEYKTDKTGGTKITNVAYAQDTEGSAAVNVDKLKDYVDKNGGGSWDLTTNSDAANKATIGKNDTVDFTGANGVKVSNDGAKVTVGLENKITIGKTGKPGKPGEPGEKGEQGFIGLAGPAGKDGVSGITTIRTENGKDGLDGLNGKDGMTRIIYQDPSGKDHQVATMDDGLRFAGDNYKYGDKSTVAYRKLNEKLDITGGAKGELTEGNIGVIAGEKGLEVKLAKDLKDLDSVNAGGTTMDKNGLTIGDKGDNQIIIHQGTVSMGGNTITNVAPGVNGTDAVNKNQLDKVTNDAKLNEKHIREGYYTVGAGGKKNTITMIQENGEGKAVGTVELRDVASASKLDELDDFAVKYDKNTDGTVNKNSVTLGGTSYDKDKHTGGTTITNVAYAEADKYLADGKTPNEKYNGSAAVNVDLLKDQIASVKQYAGDSDIHVKEGEYEVKDNKVSMGLVDGKGNDKGTVTIKDVASANDVGNVGGLRDDLKNKDEYGKPTHTSIVEAVNKLDDHVNEVDNKVGDLNYSKADKNEPLKDGDSVTEAIGKLNQAVTDAAGTAKKHTTVTAGNGIDLVESENKDGGKNYQVGLQDDVTFGGKEGQGAVEISGSKGDINATGTIKAGNVVVNGLDKDGKPLGTVSGLSNTTWDSKLVDKDATDGGYKGSTNAATESQLQQAMSGAVQYDRDDKGNVTNNITLNKGGDSVTITNVADGKVEEGSKDAVNGGQLNKVQNQVDGNSTAITNIAGSVNKLGNRVNRVGAGAAALAALHPLDFDPDDKWDFSAGYGNYAGANAVAVGAYYRPNEDTMFSVGGSMGGGENMVNAGISVKLGQGNHVSTSRVAMAKEIKDLRAVVVMQGKQIQDLVSIVNQLTGAKLYEKNVADVPFPDVPENHWAYEYVHDLVKQGIIEGYPDGMYGGDRSMTRYEMAAFIWRLLQRGVNVPDKLQAEFHMELERFRVDTVAKDKDGRPTIERVRVNKVQ